MVRGSVNSIETMGLVDGPGIRTVIFLNSCLLRCKYCHNPETWKMGNKNMTVDDLIQKVLRSKPYFKNNGGVTFSGGEPLLQYEFLLECCKRLKKENIHIAIDTAGYTPNNCEELLKYVDLVLLDIKHTTKDGFKSLTGGNKDIQDKFIEQLNKSGKKVWIRQVIVPGIMDNDEYLYNLNKTIKNIKNVERIDFLPYHKLGKEKYITMGINYPLENILEMSKEEANKLYNKFMKIYKKED